MSTHDVDHRLSPLPETGYVYRTSWPVATGDVGGDLNLRLDGVARYIQEVGAENLVDAGEAEEHPTGWCNALSSTSSNRSGSPTR